MGQTVREKYLWHKYGLTLQDYQKLLKAQNGVCFICGHPPKTRALSVDHEHIKNFKKLPPQEKQKYCRGLLCFRCNHRFMSRGMSEHIAQRLLVYLQQYGRKRRI